MIPELIYIAVLGDLHGHFTLAYRLLKRWEREHRITLSLILQVGDLGAYPPPFRLDRATRRFAEDDPDELSFRDYQEGVGEAAEILGRKARPQRRIAAEMWFIRGNHEDFEYLYSLPEPEAYPLAVDANEKIRYLPNGSVYTAKLGNHTLRIGALGGIAAADGPGNDPISPHYTLGEVRRLLRRAPGLDILLTHDLPRGTGATLGGRYAEAGSAEVADLVAYHRPAFHFCGHYHEAGQLLSDNGATRSYLLNHLNFRNAYRLNPGCIGIMRWNGRDDAQFAVLDEPWLREYRRDTFRHLE